MKQTESESAVSETIGTVLVVALTVIMAALIAAYLFGMLNGISPTRTVAATADQPDPTHILVTYRGGPDQALLANLTIIWPSGSSQTIALPKVGDVYTYTGSGITPGKDHVVVTAIFANNASQVILDTFV